MSLTILAMFAVEGARHLLWLGDEGKRGWHKEQAFFRQQFDDGNRHVSVKETIE